jgi:hypothetical protein
MPRSFADRSLHPEEVRYVRVEDQDRLEEMGQEILRDFPEVEVDVVVEDEV